MMEVSLNEVAGHLAFALSACAYAMRRIVWLRAFSMVIISAQKAANQSV